MDNVNDLTIKLERLAEKQTVWQKMTPADKLPYLESIREEWLKLGPQGFAKLLGEPTATMKQISGKEQELDTSLEGFLGGAFAGYINSLIETYKVLSGTSEATEDLMAYQKRTVGDQTVAQVFPLLKEDKAGPTKEFVGEVWFQRGVKPEDVQPFQFDKVQDKKDGVLCVLGAGNYNILTPADVLHALFVRNRVVFCKPHPIRSFQDKFLRVVFHKLYQDGFLDSMPNMSIEETKTLVYSDFVTSVHMTGGKASHDMIVWGPPEEQAKNKANKTPVLKAEMTSELGAASPYIMTCAEYTPEELEHQAKALISAKWCNGSASCNAPQNIIVSKEWKQRDAFISALEDAWKNSPSVATYYPGAPQRWKAFHEQYADSSKIIHNKEQPEGKIDETHLPLLMVDVNANLSTSEGRAKAEKEYTLKNEAFAPVLTIVTMDDNDYLSKAVELSNEHMFGSLSCTFAVPASAEGTVEVERAIANLKYGAIAVNAWPGQAYCTWPLTWGGIYGETLDKVESGIGVVINSMMFTDVEKSVLRTPCIHPMHFDFVKSPDENIGYLNFVSNMLFGIENEEKAHDEKKED